MAHKITEETVKTAMEMGWSEEDVRRGYSVFTADFGNGVEHIELINEIGAFESDEEAAEQAEKDGIKIIRNLEFIEGHEGFYIDTPENRQKLLSVIKHDVPDDTVIVELNLWATGYYSGAKYDETLIFTKEDFLKLFVANGLTVDKLRGCEISCGELDGKHSDVDGNIIVTCWEHDKIENIKSADEIINSGDFLFEALTSEYNIWEPLADIEETPITCAEINKATARAENYLKENKKYKHISVKIPIEKEAEVKAYITKMCADYEASHK